MTNTSSAEYKENFLRVIADKTEDMIDDDAKEAKFLKSIEAYRKMRGNFIQDRQQYKDEAIANFKAKAVEMQKNRQKQLAKIKAESEVKAKEKELDEEMAYIEAESIYPPISKEKWEQGWELEKIEITVDGNADKKYWRPPSPFNPDAWIKHYYGSSFCNSLSEGFPRNPEALIKPDGAEKLICEYIVLAVIYDNAPIMPQSRKLCSPHDEEWAYDLWSSISWFTPMPEESMSFGERRAPLISQALKHVRKDLDKKPAKTGQEASEGNAGDIKKKLRSLEGEWSNPMTKSTMMSKVNTYGYKKFNTFAKQYGLRQAGNRQLWQIRLDGMDRNTRQKFEKT